jgi:uncharacterized protein (TIGR00251 family)
MIRDIRGGVELDVRVIPRARKTTIDGIRDGALLLRVAAAPLEGAANDALIEYLAGVLDLPRRAVRLVSGERGRKKRLAIEGINADRVRAVIREISTFEPPTKP